jgi:hypothetical protein
MHLILIATMRGGLTECKPFARLTEVLGIERDLNPVFSNFQTSSKFLLFP